MEGRKAQGGKEFRKYENGERLTKNQMCKAKCYDCTCGFEDGRLDCKIPECPLYPQMPYRDKVKYPTFKSASKVARGTLKQNRGVRQWVRLKSDNLIGFDHGSQLSTDLNGGQHEASLS